MKLIGLTGLPRSGKDTFAERLVDNHNFQSFAFAKPLKAAAAVLLNRTVSEMEGKKGFDREAILPEWNFTTRWFLQILGTECMRNIVHPDFWIQHMRNRLEGVQRAVITDVRFPNEAELVHELGGVVIEIRRPGVTRSGHSSDAGVVADDYVENTAGVLDLWHEADSLARTARLR
jgi:hypothetical protein